jgi:hypothetical protein
VGKREPEAGRCAVEYGEVEGPFYRASGSMIQTVHGRLSGGSVELHYSSRFRVGRGSEEVDDGWGGTHLGEKWAVVGGRPGKVAQGRPAVVA